jgi:hypothetical protein
VFENGVSREIFGRKKDEMTGAWRRPHYEDLYYLYCSPNIIRVIKSRRIRWVGHVARMRRREVYTEFWWGDLRGKDRLKDLGVEGRIILNSIFKKWDGETWAGFI